VHVVVPQGVAHSATAVALTTAGRIRD
jgi:hypothetical protein